LATIDDARVELVLRKKTAASVKDVEKASAVKVVAVTMWLAGWGSLYRDLGTG